MTFAKSTLAASAALCTLAAPSFAHHPSAGGSTGASGPINVIGAATLSQGQGAAAIMFELIKLDPISDHTLEHLAEDDVHAHSMRRILSPSLVLAYGITNDLTVSARLPFLRRDDIREAHHDHHAHHTEIHARGDASGIGDLTFLAQYRFLRSSGGGEAALLLGVKAPTGETSDRDTEGALFEAEFQPGSGSWDGLFGIAVSQGLGAVSFHASALYSLVTEGSQDTDLGDRLHYGIAMSYRLGGMSAPGGPMYAGVHHHKGKAAPHHHHEDVPASPSLAVDLILELNGEWAAKQEIAGVKDANSGGHTLYVSPGVRMSYDRLSAFASVGIPIVNDLNGVQAEPDWRLFTGLAVAF